MRRDLVKVFLDTQGQYLGTYKGFTDKLIKEGTYVYTEDIDDLQIMPHPKMPNKNMNVDVVIGGTVEVGKWFVNNWSKTAILNFADGLVPGGLLLTGATTQEENICRCSNLYASLTSETAKVYYEENSEVRLGVYTDDIIYSKDVLFFKDDLKYENIIPYTMDVITCPAPSIHLPKSIEQEIIYNRIEKIIKVAALNKVNNLILGAWGCGAFGQNPEVVSKAFAQAVKKYPAFDNVIYAIRHEKSSKENLSDDANYSRFLENCKGA